LVLWAQQQLLLLSMRLKLSLLLAQLPLHLQFSLTLAHVCTVEHIAAGPAVALVAVDPTVTLVDEAQI